MTRRKGIRTSVAILVMMTLITASGCEILSTSTALSFSAGWYLGRTTTPTQTHTQCYENGTLIDCANLDLASSP